MKYLFIFLVVVYASVSWAAQSVPEPSKEVNTYYNFNGLDIHLLEKLYLQDDDGTNTLEFRAPINLTDDLTKFVLPSSNGVAGQVLYGDGSGNLGYRSGPFWTSVCTTGCDYATLQGAITGLGTTGGLIVLLEDIVTTGLVIADNTDNLTIVSYNLKKVTKSGTTPSSRAVIIGDGSTRIVLRGMEFDAWDEGGDYVFFAESSTPPEYVYLFENYLNAPTNVHNFSAVITSDNYVYDLSNID